MLNFIKIYVALRDIHIQQLCTMEKLIFVYCRKLLKKYRVCIGARITIIYELIMESTSEKKIRYLYSEL